MKKSVLITIEKINKQYNKVRWGNSAVYTFILLLLSEIGEIGFDDFILTIEKIDTGLVNPVLDVTSKMLYESKELCFTYSGDRILTLTAKGKNAASTCTL